MFQASHAKIQNNDRNNRIKGILKFYSFFVKASTINISIALSSRTLMKLKLTVDWGANVKISSA